MKDRTNSQRADSSKQPAPQPPDRRSPDAALLQGGDLAERKRVEEHLRDSVERYRTVFESLDQGFCTIEVLFDDNEKPVDYRFLMVNPAFARQTGIPDAAGRRIRDIAPLHEEHWYEKVGQIALTGESMRFESLAGALQRSYELLAWKIGGPGESTVAVLFNDITGRRQMDERLRRSEARWNAALEHIAEGVVMATEAGQLIYWNRAAMRMCGLTSADEGLVSTEEASKTFEVWTSDGRQRLTVAEWPLSRIRRGEAVRDVELRMRRPDQDLERIISCSGATVETPSGERLVHVFLSDLTEQRKAEEATRQSARQFEEVIDGSPGLVFIKDLEGRFLMVNQTFAQLCGLSPEEVRGKTDYDLFPPEQADVSRENDRRVVEAGTTFQIEEPVKAQWYLTSKFPLRDASGRVYALCGISTDITERKQSDERWREMQKLESLGLLAGGVAHDFNNLLTGVIGYASLIQEMLEADHPASELVNGIIQTGEQLAHLTKQILAYSGKGRFVLQPLNLSAMVHEMSELLHTSIPKTVTLHFDLGQDLPAIEADRGQTQQILMNLVTNAGEAIGNHDGLITVRTRSREVDDRYTRTHPEAAGLSSGEYVVLQVRDTGCGMDTAVKAKIFDPFFSTKFVGRGLGLAAVAGIVRGHKGALIVSSHPGKGSVFDVLLPASARPGRAQRAADPDVTEKSLGVVLVIDDEPIVRQIARMALERKGYSVLEADDSLAALHIFKRHPGKIDLAILDLSMPGMSGEELLPELKKIRPEVKVLLSSGYTESDSMTVFQGQQVFGFLQKPYTAAKLAETVTLALS